MRSLLKRFWHSRAAATATEFALVAGPMILILLGTIEFGRALWARQALQQVATEIARCAAIPQEACATGSTYDAMKTKATAQSLAGRNGIGLQSGDISVIRSTSCGGLSSFTRVTLKYEFNTPLSAIMVMFNDGLHFEANACYPNQ